MGRLITKRILLVCVLFAMLLPGIASATFPLKTRPADTLVMRWDEESGREGVVAELENKLSIAREFYEMVEYKDAADLFLEIAQDSRATSAQRLEAWSTRAICLAALDDEAGARDAFVEVLKINPSYRLPSMVSPKISEAYDSAVRYIESRTPKPKAEPPAVPPPQMVEDDPVDDRGGLSLSAWGIVFGGGSLATLAGGGTLGFLAARGERIYNEEQHRFETQQEALEFREKVLTQARLSNNLYIAGGALGVVSITLYILDARRSSRPKNDFVFDSPSRLTFGFGLEDDRAVLNVSGSW